MNAILSIKPQFVNEIEAGRKLFEYRKSIFRQPVERVYIYASSPVGRIVGEFQPVDVVFGVPAAVWEETWQFSGITKRFFDEYFMGRSSAYAIEIRNFVKYDIPLDLPLGVHAPQNFCYIDSLIAVH